MYQWGLLLLLFSLISCSSSRTKNVFGQSGFSKYHTKDYIDHLSALSQVYISLFELSKKSHNFLESLRQKIISANRTLFQGNSPARFHILESSIPFHFSLPGEKFFLSTALLKDFLETEDLLRSIIVFEMIKTNRNIYPKKILVPIGLISTSRILEFTRIPFEAKAEIDKWAFLSLKRAGFDPSSYLLWIQIQNRNSTAFSLQLMGRDISREEHSLKNFLVKEGNGGKNVREDEKNSSPGFYQLIKEIEDKANES